MTHRPWRTLIADDEPVARRGLRRLIEADPDIDVIAECGNGRETVDRLTADAPELVFLDVEMPFLDGLSCLATAGPDLSPVIVVVSAHPQYAVGAFQARAIDYLVKPFSDARLAESLGRAKHQLALRTVAARASLTARRIGVRTARGLRIVAVDDVDWIEADDYESLLHVRQERLRVREPLASLEGRLDPAQFVRVHRSAIINITRVVEVESYFHGRHILRLATGSTVILARGRRAEFDRALGHAL